MPRSVAQARQLGLRHGRSATVYQVLNPGMRHCFHPRRQPRPSLRAQLNRARNQPRLAVCLGQWRAHRPLSLGVMANGRLLDRLESQRVFVTDSGGGVFGFFLASPVVCR